MKKYSMDLGNSVSTKPSADYSIIVMEYLKDLNERADPKVGCPCVNLLILICLFSIFHQIILISVHFNQYLTRNNKNN